MHRRGEGRIDLIEVHALSELAEARRKLGQYQAAVDVLIVARDLAKRSSDPFTEAQVARRLGQIYEKLEAVTAARTAYMDAARLLERTADPDHLRIEVAADRVRQKIQVAEAEIVRLDREIAELSSRIESVGRDAEKDEFRRARKHAARMRKRLRQRLGRAERDKDGPTKRERAKQFTLTTTPTTEVQV